MALRNPDLIGNTDGFSSMLLVPESQDGQMGTGITRFGLCLPL